MGSFEISSDRDILVDGIGLIKAGESRTTTDGELRYFKVLNSVDLAKANFPDFVEITYNLSEEV